ncbi:hypothetical protein [Thauera sp.]|uniref:hypothetical protein n=1 Tax=Thauera sp. TaxID=1905334 RepID=UPI0039E6F08E
MRLRHKTTTAVIDEPQWNEDHVCALHELGSINGAVSIDLAHGSVQTATLTGNVTLTLPSVAVGTTEHLTLIFANDNAGGHAVTVTSVTWIGGSAPEFSDAANAQNCIVLRGTPGGWVGDGGTVA